MNVAKRVEDLERARGHTEKKVLVVGFCSPNAPTADGKFPVTGYRTLDGGQSWHVREGETAHECRDRAEREVVANEWNVAVLLEEQKEEIAA